MNEEHVDYSHNGITSSGKDERTRVLRNRSDASEETNDWAINASKENHPACFHLHNIKNRPNSSLFCLGIHFCEEEKVALIVNDYRDRKM